jgi:hypothetical protein
MPKKRHMNKYEERNEVLEGAILARWPSVAAFCREKKFCEVVVGQLINLKKSPLKKRGGFLLTCKRISAILCIDCEDLFSLRSYGLIALRRRNEVLFSELSSEVGLFQITEEDAITNELFIKEIRGWLEELFELLNPRDGEIIRLLFGFDGVELSILEVANIHDVTYSCIWEIKNRALRKLKELMLEMRIIEEAVE